MTDIHEVFDAQEQLQRDSYGNDPVVMTEEQRAEYIRWNVLALTDELHEALNEVGWKPWATSRHLNREAYKGELVDAFHFFINLCLAGGIAAEELLDGYYAKRSRNAKRQTDGYTGLDKCPGCKRAWDDIEQSTLLRWQEVVGDTVIVYCSTTCAAEATSSSR